MSDTSELLYSGPIRRWDEGLPLGNGLLGCLVWGEGDALNLSLDRADLWDLTPVPEFDSPDYRFSFVRACVAAKDLAPVRAIIETPYKARAAPTKLPGGRLVLRVPGLDDATFQLDTKTATARVATAAGLRVEVVVLATEPIGWITIDGLTDVHPRVWNPFAGDYPPARPTENEIPCAKLGYSAGERLSGPDETGYYQPTGGGDGQTVLVKWRTDGARWTGVWTIQNGGRSSIAIARKRLDEALSKPAAGFRELHRAWWTDFHQHCDIRIDDPALEHAWRINNYYFGAAARSGAPPICLQGPWTCDEGWLPPWKGDYHHNLNTQFCYYQAFAANHLDAVRGFLDWLWDIKPACEAWTRKFYERPGLNAPGVMGLDGQCIGGWHQYSHSPTSAGWLAHFFTIYVKYSGDRAFLRDRAWPWLRACAEFFEAYSERGPDGKRVFPLSSSAEINNNTLEAWFPNQLTNYDLSIVRSVLNALVDFARVLERPDEEARWVALLGEFPELPADANGMLIAPGYPLPFSHRHHAHLMGLSPLGLIRPFASTKDRDVAERSLRRLEELGTSQWVGYSFSWRAALYALVGDGERAARDLHIFASAFTAPNGFHLNGDQSGRGYSKWTTRPFTLEGNFIVALAIQQMLLQSDDGVIRVFPAVPASWRHAEFTSLRAAGGFLVSARMAAGRVLEVEIRAETGGRCVMADPFAERGAVAPPFRRFTLAAGEVVRLLPT
jgi:alpha-L-fucosidase 2